MTEVDGRCLNYDANGNQTSGWNFTQGRARALSWTSYNKPRTIVESGVTLTFDYGADRARFRQVNSLTGVTTHYVGALYEKQVQGSTVTHVHYLQAGGTAIALYKSVGTVTAQHPAGDPSGDPILRYLHRDHIGSVTEITDENAQLVEEAAYDAWGKRRHPDWSDAIGQLSLTETFRGFTNHEMLDEVSLIHMNGRVYDPELGRFLSADPFIQEAGNLQSFNRYTYVLNNPLSYTDPSGYFSFKRFLLGTVVGGPILGLINGFTGIVNKLLQNRVVATVFQIAVCTTGPASCAAAAGAVTAANGGGIGDILKSAALTYATAHAFGELHLKMNYGPAKILAHGIVGGAFSELQGGSFLEGFLSAGFTQAVSPGINRIMPNDSGAAGVLMRTGAAAVVGGTAAVLGGGKFRNGAMTGAFAYLFSEGLRERTIEGGQGAGGPRDRSVYAAEDGTVETLGWENPNDTSQGYGYRLKLRADADSSLFIYGHLDPASLAVVQGDTVVAGQYLGIYADPTNGSSTGPHLHFEWRSATGVRLDPAGYRSFVVPSYVERDYIRFRGVHPVTGLPRWHNGYDLVGPFTATGN